MFDQLWSSNYEMGEGGGELFFFHPRSEANGEKSLIIWPPTIMPQHFFRTVFNLLASKKKGGKSNWKNQHICSLRLCINKMKIEITRSM